MKIIILEPNEEKGLVLQKKLNEIWNFYKQKYPSKIDLEFTYLTGYLPSKELRGDFSSELVEYKFYDDSIIQQLNQIIINDRENAFGILMNPILSQEEDNIDNLFFPEYPYPLLSVKIWKNLKNNLPIYLETPNPNFFVKSATITGEDFSDICIHQDIIIKFNIEVFLKRMFEYYIQDHPKKKIKCQKN